MKLGYRIFEGKIRTIFKIKNLKALAYALGVYCMIMSLTGCNDDPGFRSDYPNNEFDGRIKLIINVPDATVIHTRADNTEKEAAEKCLSTDYDHFALVYKKDNENNYKLLQSESIEISDQNKTWPLTINEKISAEEIKIIVVSNVGSDDVSKFSSLKKGDDIEKLYDLKSSSINTQPSSPFIMSGEAKTSNTDGTYVVNLQRSAAKVSLEVKENVEKYFVPESFSLYNAASQGYFTAFVAKENQDSEYVYQTGNEIFTCGEEDSWEMYCYPVVSAGKAITEITGAYFILKGQYEGEECYYRVDLRKSSDNTYYNINPNHHYQIEIVDVLRKGYPSREEASRRSMEMDPALKVIIYDHVAEVLSMTTDGTRELGAVENVELINSLDLTVKLYSQFEEDYSLDKLKFEIVEGEDWLDVTSPSTLENVETNAGESGDIGKRGKYTIKIKENVNVLSDRRAIVRITWMGLTRNVEVWYNTMFDHSKLFESVILYLNFPDNTRYDLDNYWELLENHVDGLRPVDGNRLADMADGKVRNKGFHFPMPYGENGQVTYRYGIRFNNHNYIESVDFETTGDRFFDKSNMKLEHAGSANDFWYLSLKSPEENDFTYATGTITFKIKYYSEDNIPDMIFSLDLYHTGFIDTSNRGVSKYCYYEVVPLGEDSEGNKLYWLDRNIGAASNMMYMDNIESSEGNENARGYFYKIANYGNNNSDPVIKGEDFNDKEIIQVCPPGYRIPNTADWDALRLSSNFKTKMITEGNTSYLATYYETGDKKIGRVYFPKGRFYESESDLKAIDGIGLQKIISTNLANSGDPGSGYYWTSTIASGLNKNEIGHWLTAINLNGSSSTYINGRIDRHEMNVRCIAKISHKDENQNNIAFNVKGATHVYLYSKDSRGNKNGLFAFPGKTIGSVAAVKGLDYKIDNNLENYMNSYLRFSYNSVIPAESLYVFFVYKDEDGVIRIISENGDTTLAGAKGWPVKVGYNYFFTNDGKYTKVENSIFEFPWEVWN